MISAAQKRAKRSLAHGIVNILLPFAVLLLRHLGIEAENPWAWFIPMLVITLAPFVSDAAAIVIAGVRLGKSRDGRVVAGLILSVAAAAIYAILRFVLKV